jgi:hypothetical protein
MASSEIGNGGRNRMIGLPPKRQKPFFDACARAMSESGNTSDTMLTLETTVSNVFPGDT